MADDDAKTEDTDEETPAKKKVAGKTIVLFVIIPVLLIMIGGLSAALLLSGGKEKPVEVAHAEDDAHDDGHGEKDDGHDKKKDDHGKKDDGHGKKDGYGGDTHGDGPKRESGTLQVGYAGDPSYYIMPDILVNLSSTEGDRQLFLKLKLTLEAEDPEMFSDIPKLLPRITDQYQMFLRELRVDDLNGSAGGYQLRTELLRRINLAISPSRVDAVLIEEMLVQ